MNFIYSLPPANEVWGKVIYLQVCTIHGRGGAWSGEVPASGGVPGLGGSCPRGGAWSRGRGEPAPGGCLVETPQTATAAGGKHPTGMHSCLNLKYKASSEKKTVFIQKSAYLMIYFLIFLCIIFMSNEQIKHD